MYYQKNKERLRKYYTKYHRDKKQEAFNNLVKRYAQKTVANDEVDISVLVF
jgi:hypothetical protein